MSHFIYYYAECCYADYRYAECHYAESRSACKKFYSRGPKPDFFHRYVGEGMEEGEFAEAREDLVPML